MENEALRFEIDFSSENAHWAAVKMRDTANSEFRIVGTFTVDELASRLAYFDFQKEYGERIEGALFAGLPRDEFLAMKESAEVASMELPMDLHIIEPIIRHLGSGDFYAVLEFPNELSAAIFKLSAPEAYNGEER